MSQSPILHQDSISAEDALHAIIAALREDYDLYASMDNRDAANLARYLRRFIRDVIGMEPADA